MTRRQSYFVKQKLIGLGILAVAMFMLFGMKDGVVALVLFPFGWVALTTKDMVIMDSYYWEIEEEREFRRKMRRAHR